MYRYFRRVCRTRRAFWEPPHWRYNEGVSTVAAALVTLDEFFQMPCPEDGAHLELHDGEVVVFNPPSLVHVYIQQVISRWLIDTAQERGSAQCEFPYRPAANLQFWRADVAYIPKEDWRSLRSGQYPVYAPQLIVEVLSPSNLVLNLNRQRIVAFSAGTKEFWTVDPEAQIVEVSKPGASTMTFGITGVIPLTVLPGAEFPVRLLFE
jgi:Uma2 family endonuclease